MTLLPSFWAKRKIYLFFNLFNFNASFLWPQRNEAERNSRRRFRSHENCIIQQSSLTTRDFVYFLMFQNHSNSSTLCFINILGSLRYCRFLVTWYLLYFISRHSEFISESNTEEMLKQVQHDCWGSCHSEFANFVLCRTKQLSIVLWEGVRTQSETRSSTEHSE